MNNNAELAMSYNEYIEKIPSGLMMLVEKFRSNEIQAAIKIIQEFSEGLEWLISASSSLNANNITTTFSLETIENALDEMNDSLEKQDFFAVADIFEYEIIPYFKELEFNKVSVQ